MKIYLCFSLLILLGACTQSSQSKTKEEKELTEYERVRQEALDLHDLSMERMGELKQTMKKVKKDTSLTNRTQLLRDLKKADDDMWHWMHTYKEADSTWSDDKKLAHYGRFLSEIHVVDSQIVRSIQNSKKALNE